MPQRQPQKSDTPLLDFIASIPGRLKNVVVSYWRTRLLNRIICVILALLVVWTGVMYGVAEWYIYKHRNEPVTFGATFIKEYAEYYGLDAKETLNAMINDLGIRKFRLVSYWKDIEAVKGTYDFSGLDWQFDMIAKAGGKVSLAIGIRQPRWPECHEPEWAKGKPTDEWYPHLKNFMTAVINHYKNNQILESYQLENEFFMSVFGECTDFDRNRLIDEYNHVKSLDPNRTVIISRSNNWIGVPLGKPRPDMFAISVYKRVWDKTFTKRYFEYPLPAWFYAMLAGWGEILTGRNMIIHELQAESWLPEGFDMRTASVDEQDKSLNQERLRHRMQYGKATGMKDIYLWGVEWWYWRKTHLGDPNLWNAAKDVIEETNANYP